MEDTLDATCGANPSCIVREAMLGLTRTDVGNDLVSPRRKRFVDTKRG